MRFFLQLKVLLGLLSLMPADAWGAESNDARFVDLSHWTGEEPLTLKGPWEFYWQKLLMPGDEPGVPDAMLKAGGAWADV